jgi:phosphoglycolate phosphatase-like HAD superfamily hydrolase
MNNAQRIREADSLAGIETLVFDLDGTLVDSAPGIGISLKVAFEAVGLVMPCGDLPSLVGPQLT